MEKSNFSCDLNPPQPKKSKVLPAALISLAILFVGGITGAYFYLGKPDLVSDVPPTLDLIGSKFQGQSIGQQLGSLVFDQTDVDTFNIPMNANFKFATKGVQYYFSDPEPEQEQDQYITVEEIINNIKPKVGLQILIAFYSPGEKALGTNKCYYIYPKGPYSATCPIQDIKNFKISKGRGYAIIASEDFEYNANVIKNSKTSPSAEYLENFKASEGWVLLPVEDQNTLKTNLSNNVWVLSADNQFVKVDQTNPALKNNYTMAWFKISPQDVYQAR